MIPAGVTKTPRAMWPKREIIKLIKLTFQIDALDKL